MNSILVYDNDPKTLNLLNDALGSYYDITIASSKNDAISVASRYTFDIALFAGDVQDLTLEGLTQALVASNPDIYLFLLASAAPSEDFTNFSKTIGAEHVFHKPFSLKYLKAKLDFYLTNRPRHISI